MDTDLVGTYRKIKWRICKTGSVLLRFQEEGTKIEVSLKFFPRSTWFTL